LEEKLSARGSERRRKTMEQEFQELLSIVDRKTLYDLVDKLYKKIGLRFACRLIYEGIQDDKLIARVTGCKEEEVDVLRNSYLTLEDAAKELRVSEKRMRKYIKQGFIYHDQGMPKYAVVLATDPVYAYLMQLDCQEKKLKANTTLDWIRFFEEEIADFEEKYGGKFNELFGHLTDEQIDGMDEAIDIMNWKELEEDLRYYRSKLTGEGKEKNTEDTWR
jgi:hypothetical protein